MIQWFTVIKPNYQAKQDKVNLHAEWLVDGHDWEAAEASAAEVSQCFLQSLSSSIVISECLLSFVVYKRELNIELM